MAGRGVKRRDQQGEEALAAAVDPAVPAATGADGSLWEWSRPGGGHPPEILRLCGHSQHDGIWCKSLIHSEDRQKATAYFTDYIEGKIQGDYEVTYRVRRGDGSWRWINSRAACIRDNDSLPALLVGVRRDITDDLLLERQVRQSEKMDSLCIFAGGIAHEFNNILMTITGFSEIIKDVDDLTAVHSAADMVLKSAARAQELTDKLLALRPRKPFSLHAVDVSRLVRSILSDSQLGKVEVVQEISPGLRVVAEMEEIRQVLQNVVANAVDAMPQQGVLTVTAGEVALGAEEASSIGLAGPGRYARISVQDTGCGMSPAVKDRMFEPFFTTKGAWDRSGLGLALAYRIVRKHCGAIAAESEEGRGSLFDIYLPLADSRRGSQHVEAAPRPEGEKETILVVEDDNDVRIYASTALRLEGYRVFTRRDGAEAVELLEKQHVDLVVTDVQMPRMNGPQLVSALRAHNPGQKIVYMSGYAPDAVPVRTGDAGIRYVQKPVTREEFLRVVRSALDS